MLVPFHHRTNRRELFFHRGRDPWWPGERAPESLHHRHLLNNICVPSKPTSTNVNKAVAPTCTLGCLDVLKFFLLPLFKRRNSTSLSAAEVYVLNEEARRFRTRLDLGFLRY